VDGTGTDNQKKPLVRTKNNIVQLSASFDHKPGLLLGALHHPAKKLRCGQDQRIDNV